MAPDIPTRLYTRRPQTDQRPTDRGQFGHIRRLKRTDPVFRRNQPCEEGEYCGACLAEPSDPANGPGEEPRGENPHSVVNEDGVHGSEENAHDCHLGERGKRRVIPLRMTDLTATAFSMREGTIQTVISKLRHPC